MKHLVNLAKAVVAAGIVVEGGSRIAGKLPAAVKLGSYDARPVAGGALAMFGVLTVLHFAGAHKIASKVVPA